MNNPYIQYLNLPSVPTHIIDNINSWVHDYSKNMSMYWTDVNNQEIDTWGKEHISNDMYFAFQIFKDDVPVHKDVETLTKLNYLISPGGSNVLTEFFDGQITVASYNIEPLKWHVLKADTPHHVVNVKQLRYGITARIFG